MRTIDLRLPSLPAGGRTSIRGSGRGRAGPPSRPAPLPFLLRRFIFPPKEGSLLGFSIPPWSPMLPNISPHHLQCGRLNPGKTGPTDPRFTTRCHPRATHEPAAAQARTRTCPQPARPPHSPAHAAIKQPQGAATEEARHCHRASP